MRLQGACLWIGLALTCASAFLRGGDQPMGTETGAVPVGYLIDPQFNDNDNDNGKGEEPDATAVVSCIRKGESIQAQEGFEVYPGDVIVTGGNTEMGVAFLDSSAITLRASTRLAIDEYAYPAKLVPTRVTLEGRAYFSVTPRPDNAHFFVRTLNGAVEVKGTQFQIYTNMNSDGKTMNTQVGVTQGTISLKPLGSEAIDVTTGNSGSIVSIVTQNVTGFTGSSETVSKGNIDKKTLAGLKKHALSGVQVNINKNGTIKIKASTFDADGNTTVARVTELAGGPLESMNYTIKDRHKRTVFNYRDTGKHVSIKRTFEDFKLSGTATAQGGPGSTRMGKGTLVDPVTGERFIGTVSADSINPAASPIGRINNANFSTNLTGPITENVTNTIVFNGVAKDGTHVFYMLSAGEEICVVTSPNSSVGKFTEVINNPDGSQSTITGQASVNLTTNTVTPVVGSTSTSTVPPGHPQPPAIYAPTFNGGNTPPISGG